MSIKLILFLTILLLLNGCGSEKRIGNFCDQSREEWMELTSGKNVKEIYDYYKLSLKCPPPNDTIIAESLGLKGKESIIYWINDAKATGEVVEPWEFRPILISVFKHTNYSICNDNEMYNHTSNMISQVRNIRERSTVDSIIGLCVGRNNSDKNN